MIATRKDVGELRGKLRYALTKAVLFKICELPPPRYFLCYIYIHSPFEITGLLGELKSLGTIRWRVPPKNSPVNNKAYRPKLTEFSGGEDSLQKPLNHATKVVIFPIVSTRKNTFVGLQILQNYRIYNIFQQFIRSHFMIPDPLISWGLGSTHPFVQMCWSNFYLVVSTPLKNMSQIGFIFPR